MQFSMQYHDSAAHSECNLFPGSVAIGMYLRVKHQQELWVICRHLLGMTFIKKCVTILLSSVYNNVLH